MQHRKIQRVGGGSYVLSLPKRWIGALGLKKGDELEVKEGQGALIVSAGRNGNGDIKEVDADREIIYRAVTAAYLSGYDQIRIHSKSRLSAAQKKELKQTMRRTMGMEIIEESANELLLKDLIDPQEVDIMRIIRRAYVLAAGMHKDAAEAIANNDRDLGEEVAERDNEVDRLYFRTIRELKSALTDAMYGFAGAECMDLRILAKNIETIGDCCCSMVGKAAEMGRQVNVKKISDMAYALHEGAFASFVEKDVKKAEAIRQRMASFRRMKLNAFKPENASILEELENIAECGINISDLVI